MLRTLTMPERSDTAVTPGIDDALIAAAIAFPCFTALPVPATMKPLTGCPLIVIPELISVKVVGTVAAVEFVDPSFRKYIVTVC